MVDSMPPCTAPYKSRGQKDPSCVVDVTASRPAFIAQNASSPCATSRRPPADDSWPLTGVSTGASANLVCRGTAWMVLSWLNAAMKQRYEVTNRQQYG